MGLFPMEGDKREFQGSFPRGMDLEFHTPLGFIAAQSFHPGDTRNRTARPHIYSGDVCVELDRAVLGLATWLSDWIPFANGTARQQGGRRRRF